MSKLRNVWLYDANGDPWVVDGNGGMPVNIVGISPESNGGWPVNKQDQATPPVIIPANKVVVTTTLAATVTVDTNTCSVASITSIAAGQMLILTSTVANRYYWGYITNVNPVGNILTVNNRFDYAFESGQEASACTNNLGVDGSATPQIFSLRAAEPAAGIGLTVDVTRIILHMLTASTPILSDFGDIAGGIAKGLFCRKVDGTYQNIFTIRDNNEFLGLTYDLSIESSLGASGQDGLSASLTFNGDEKMGVVLRIAPLEDLQFIVQDDLSSLTSFNIMIQGHITQD